MRYGLDELFACFDGDRPAGIAEWHSGEGSLFDLNGGLSPDGELPFGNPPAQKQRHPLWLVHLFSANSLNLLSLPQNARRLFELSANAFDAVVHAWMSELPIEKEITRFAGKVFSAALAAKNGRQFADAAELGQAERNAADRTAADRGDSNVQAVLEAAYKVWHETNRLMGLLRFSPNENGVYTARCAPDHFTLPALAGHFTSRFGDSSWTIIDEKRGFCLWRAAGGDAALSPLEETPFGNPARTPAAEWENLWRQYHKTINNESRNNPELQRRFMPKRYWKYLTEM